MEVMRGGPSGGTIYTVMDIIANMTSEQSKIMNDPYSLDPPESRCGLLLLVSSANFLYIRQEMLPVVHSCFPLIDACSIRIDHTVYWIDLATIMQLKSTIPWLISIWGV